MKSIKFIILSACLLMLTLVAVQAGPRGETLLRQGRYDKALVTLLQELKVDDSAHQHLLVAKAYFYRKQDAEASAQLQLLDSKTLTDKERIMALILEGKIALRAGRLAQASASYLHLMNIAPTVPDSYLALIEIATREGNSEAVDQWTALYQSKFKGE